jgi:twitching motility two-component system response regulator PilH
MARILIVEDDRKIAMALTVRLKANKHEVLVAFDAMGGTALAVKEKPDLIILDIAMPAGGGFMVARNVQRSAVTAGIPIIFLTASKDPLVRQQAMEFEPAGFIEKPYEAEELLATIRKALGESSQSSEVPTSGALKERTTPS